MVKSQDELDELMAESHGELNELVVIKGHVELDELVVVEGTDTATVTGDADGTFYSLTNILQSLQKWKDIL